MVDTADWYAQGEAREREFCLATGKPWHRLTAAEHGIAGMIATMARADGHRRLRWLVPRPAWSVGAPWPDAKLWGIPVTHPYESGPVVLTARRWRGGPYVIGVVRGGDGPPVEPEIGEDPVTEGIWPEGERILYDMAREWLEIGLSEASTPEEAADHAAWLRSAHALAGLIGREL